MNTLSSNSDGQVKHKYVAFPHLPDSDNLQLEIPPADVTAKLTQAQDLQNSDLGAPAGFLPERPIRVPIPAGYKGNKIPGHYYLWAVLDAYQGDHDSCWPSELTLALNCQKSVRQIRRWRAKLERAKVLWIDRRGKPHHYRVKSSRHITTFVFVDPRWVSRLGLSINQAVVLGYVYFRCNGKPETWFSIRRAAEYLGLSYATIQRCLAVLAAWGFIDKRPGRLSGGRTNRYKPAPFGWIASWENYPKRALSKCPVKRNTIPEGCYSYARFTRNDSFRAGPGLSYDQSKDREAYRLFTRFGTYWKVARPAAVQWRGCAESVEQAFINGAYRFEADAETLRRHNLALLRGNYISYVIGTLNRAYREGHKVKPSTLAKAGEAKRKGRARPAAGGGVTDSQFEQRKKGQIRRLRIPPAKPVTPYTEAELALIAQKRDKEAEAKHLDAVLAAARSRSWRYRKYANLGQKVHILAKPCH